MLDVSVRRPAVSWIRRGVHKQDWCRHEYTGSDTTRENDWKKNSWTETPCIVVLCYICQGKELWSTLIHRSNESKWHILIPSSIPYLPFLFPSFSHFPFSLSLLFPSLLPSHTLGGDRWQQCLRIRCRRVKGRYGVCVSDYTFLILVPNGHGVISVACLWTCLAIHKQ